MKLSELQEMWESDAKIDPLDLSNESLKIPRLHAKYLNVLSSLRLQIRKTESDYIRLKKAKQRFYKGEMTKAELESYEWNQYLGPKLLKAEMQETIDSDDDTIAILDKLEYLKTQHFQLESILKSLNGRSFDIRNAIEFQKWTQGVV